MALADISERIAKAEQAADRVAGSVQLIAVSKVQPNARVTSVLDEGHRCFGENKVQEAGSKWPHCGAGHPRISARGVGLSGRRSIKD